MKNKSKHVLRLLQPPPMERECSFLISSVRSARKKKSKFRKLCSRSTYPLTHEAAHVARRTRGRVGVCPSASQPLNHSLSFFVCHSLTISVSYIALRVLVSACCQEELHGGGVAAARGLNESRAAKLHIHTHRRAMRRRID